MHAATNNVFNRHQQEQQHWKRLLPWQFIKILAEINSVAYQCLIELSWQGLRSQSFTCVWIQNVSSLHIDDESHERK